VSFRRKEEVEMPPEMPTLPPGPKSPAAWQIIRYSLYPLSFIEECARRWGDPFTIRLAGYGKLVMLSSPEAVRDVFRGSPQELHSGEGNDFLSLTVGRSSVLVLDEGRHARQRRILLPPLKGERMRSFFDAMQKATLDEVSRWPLRRPLRMVEPMQQITLHVILQAVLGLPPGPLLEDFAGKVRRLLAFGRSRWSLIQIKLFPRWMLRYSRALPYFRQLRALDDAIYAFIASRRALPAGERGETVLADLLAATYEDGQPVGDLEVRDALVTLLLAGHDTTALALAWALEQIVPREDVVGKIREELRRVFGPGLPRAEGLPRLDYLDAVIRESMRVRTILPFVVRLTKQPFAAGGRQYPAGVLLCPCNHLVHRRADLYPEPEAFRPERFLERKYAGHEWFPFGGGNRTCLGMAFALYEMKVVLSTLLGRVHLARPAGSRSRPVRRGVSLAPDDGARVEVVKKEEGGPV
jgi:cytochrome P450